MILTKEVEQMNRRSNVLLLVSFLIFLFCSGLGFYRAQHKPLWVDEIFSQIASVNRSYVDILLCRRTAEGTVTPLFYLIQKVICDLSHYSLPEQWETGHWDVADPRSQIILRLSSIFFMSLSIAVIFYFFTRFYSSLTGVYSFLVSLSSYMVWAYWAEARPYAHWVFFSTLQSLIFLMLSQGQGERRTLWNALIIVHFLLVLTVIFSLLQVAIVSFLASILAVVRGNFTYPVELFLLALLGMLLVASLAALDDGAVSSLLFNAFFLAALANMVYLYTVAKHLSLVRIGAIGIAVVGFLLSTTYLLSQPVPGRLKSEVRKLIAAEKKLGEARQRLEKVKEAIPVGAQRIAKRSSKAASAATSAKRRKR